MKPYAIFDMDGTLADASGRQHYLKKEPRDWDAFFSDIPLDPVIPAIAGLYRALCKSEDYEVALITGRPETCREDTERWMEKHALPLRPIFFRKDGDMRDDFVTKREIHDDFVAQGRQIAFVIEDRNSVVKMWRDLGIVCLHCFDADF